MSKIWGGYWIFYEMIVEKTRKIYWIWRNFWAFVGLEEREIREALTGDCCKSLSFWEISGFKEGFRKEVAWLAVFWTRYRHIAKIFRLFLWDDKRREIRNCLSSSSYRISLCGSSENRIRERQREREVCDCETWNSFTSKNINNWNACTKIFLLEILWRLLVWWVLFLITDTCSIVCAEPCNMTRHT